MSVHIQRWECDACRSFTFLVFEDGVGYGYKQPHADKCACGSEFFPTSHRIVPGQPYTMRSPSVSSGVASEARFEPRRLTAVEALRRRETCPACLSTFESRTALSSNCKHEFHACRTHDDCLADVELGQACRARTLSRGQTTFVVMQADIAAVRERTGCGLMDARHALEVREGVFELAVEYIERTGLAAVMPERGRYPLWTRYKEARGAREE